MSDCRCYGFSKVFRVCEWGSIGNIKASVITISTGISKSNRMVMVDWYCDRMRWIKGGEDDVVTINYNDCGE